VPDRGRLGALRAGLFAQKAITGGAETYLPGRATSLEAGAGLIAIGSPIARW